MSRRPVKVRDSSGPRREGWHRTPEIRDLAKSRAAQDKSAYCGISDAFWSMVQGLVPAYDLKPGPGRRPMHPRQVFEAVVFVLRTGCPWRSLPRRRFGSATSIHKRFLQWERAGFFLALWRAGLAEHDEMEGIAWRWRGSCGPIPVYRLAASHLPARDLERPSKSRGRSPGRLWGPAVKHRHRD